MLRRQAPAAHRPAVPTRWLMTDARLGKAMPAIAAGMPPRSAIIIRPYALETGGRAALIRSLRRIAKARRHLLLLAGPGPIAGFDGRHYGGGARMTARTSGFLSMPVHDIRQAATARRRHADAVLISPVHPTRSHPDATPLGARGFARLARGFPGRAIALGGMTEHRFLSLRSHGASGWAAIDAWQA